MTVPDLPTLLNASRKRTRTLFGEDASIDVDEQLRYSSAVTFTHLSHRARISSKIKSEYENVKELPFFLADKAGKSRATASRPAQSTSAATPQMKLIEDVQRGQQYIPRYFKLIIAEERNLQLR